MSRIVNAPQRSILIVASAIFAIFLFLPMGMVLYQSFEKDGTFSLKAYEILFKSGKLIDGLLNSVMLSSIAGLVSTFLAFVPAYAINYTNLSNKIKKIIFLLIMLPMLLPTITYGFAIIYSFGKQGLMVKLLGSHLIDIYGSKGLVMGYVIYTMPIAFMLINNTMGYIDKKFSVVSKIMGDSNLRCFFKTVITPLSGTLTISFIQCFTLSFTDYGIPGALGGNKELLATVLYNEMLGSLPNFASGSAVSIIMLIPSIISIIVISYINRYNIRYSKISGMEFSKNKFRDRFFCTVSIVIISIVLSIFLVIFVVPMVEQWPYKMNFSLVHIKKMLSDPSLIGVYKNSLFMAFITALGGTLIVYATALVTARKDNVRGLEKLPDTVSLITNTIPGMVLGVSYLLTFKGTMLQGSFIIVAFCNILHYFSSPYMMMKSSLEKLNSSWETTAKLMGDSWFKTVVRIITPNTFTTLMEVFGYFFINAMVTISAVIFITSTKTIVITTKIKELQHFANFNEIFVLSIFILITNLLVKIAINYITTKNKIKS